MRASDWAIRRVLLKDCGVCCSCSRTMPRGCTTAWRCNCGSVHRRKRGVLCWRLWSRHRGIARHYGCCGSYRNRNRWSVRWNPGRLQRKRHPWAMQHQLDKRRRLNKRRLRETRHRQGKRGSRKPHRARQNNGRLLGTVTAFRKYRVGLAVRFRLVAGWWIGAQALSIAAAEAA